jgi:catechol 2,3-dioxygenase-like lactoylglutathione lyase family enzyme
MAAQLERQEQNVHNRHPTIFCADIKLLLQPQHFGVYPFVRQETRRRGCRAYFSSLQTLGAKDTILNLEKGDVTAAWGRIIFYVEDVDRFWAHMKEKGFGPARPRDAAWGERYFHLHDPDSHELSFAQPIR